MKLSMIDVDIDKLPKIPKVVQQLITSLNDDNVEVHKLAEQIALDQVITAKVLRVANSVLFGGQGNITSTKEATVRVGINAIRSIVLASGFVSAFKAPADFDIQAFWKHSFRVSMLSQWIATLSGNDADEAFNCGMINNIGVLVIQILYPAEACHIETLVTHGGCRLQIEHSRLGFTHNDVASELANHWDFPVIYQQALLHQAEPLKSDPFSPLAMIIFIAKCIEKGICEEVDDKAIVEGISVELLQKMGVNPEQLLNGLAQARELTEASSIYID